MLGVKRKRPGSDGFDADGRARSVSALEEINLKPCACDKHGAGSMTLACIKLRNIHDGPDKTAHALLEAWNRTGVIGALIANFAFGLPLSPPNTDCEDCLPTATGHTETALMLFEGLTSIGAIMGIIGVLATIALSHNLSMMMVDLDSMEWFVTTMPVTIAEPLVVTSILCVLIGYLAGITFHVNEQVGTVIVVLGVFLIVGVLLFWMYVVRSSASRIRLTFAAMLDEHKRHIHDEAGETSHRASKVEHASSGSKNGTDVDGASLNAL